MTTESENPMRTRHPEAFRDKTVVITGARGGIGRALAVEFARRGARLALSDVDSAGLEATRELTGLGGSECLVDIVDVTDQAAVAAWAARIGDASGADVVVNNAGVAGGSGDIAETDMAEMDWVLDVNLRGTVLVTKAFLPQLIAARGRIGNISSLNGIAAQPGIAPYCTSKFAVRGFTEALRAEMETERTGVRVSVIHPGGVKTDIASNAMASAARFGVEETERHRKRLRMYNDTLLRMSPQQAAQIICDGMAAGRRRILVGRDVQATDLLVRLAPRVYPSVVAALERRFLR